MNIYFKLIILFLSVLQIETFSQANPTWNTSNYFRAGHRKLISTQQPRFQNLTFLFTFSSPLLTTPRLACGIKNYRPTDTMKNEDFQIGKINITESFFNIYFRTQGATQLIHFSVAYLATDMNFPYYMNSFQNIPINTGSNFPSQMTDLYVSYTYSNTINYQTLATNAGYSFNNFQSPLSKNKIALYLTSLYVKGDYYYLNVTFTTTILNTTHFKWSAYKIKGVQIHRCYLTAIFYNTDNIQQGGHKIIHEEWKVNGMGQVKSFPEKFMENALIGLKDFAGQNITCVLDYAWNIYTNSTYSIKVEQSVPLDNYYTCALNSSVTTIFYIKTLICPTGYDFLNMTSQKCQNQCANYYYGNLTDNRCYSCHYRCQRCSVPASTYQTCTQCLASDFRVLNNSTCICESGYFDNGYSHDCKKCDIIDAFAQLCSFKLNNSKPTSYYEDLFTSGSYPSNIMNLYTVISCKTVYYYDTTSSKCQLCILSYCTMCYNATTCQTCDNGISAKKFNATGLCYLCTIDNCKECSSDNTCHTCQYGYDLVNNTCDIWGCAVTCDCDGYMLPIVNGSCSTLCGDGYRAGYEECDDGNTISHDGCSSTCKMESCDQNCSCQGYSFPLINDTCSTVCGDGFRAGIQECDDGNLINRDGCSSQCKTQDCSFSCLCQGWVLPIVNGSCSTLCGDGYIVGEEQCEDGNTNSHDGCSSSCLVEQCSQSCLCGGWVLPYVNGSCSTVCGDGYAVGLEQCDDNNTLNQDGCSSVCQIEQCNQSCICDGWVLPYINGSCSTLCGDGIVQGIQQCDDGDLMGHDGCSQNCEIQPCQISCLCDGWIAPFINGTCSTLCGDGIVKGQEQCDDGNTNQNDECANNCKQSIIAQFSLTPLLTYSSTEYASLLLFFVFGFRIVGMQMLSIIQNFQLILQTQNVKTLQISYNIHGYSTPEHFPISIPYHTQIFDHFNFMFLGILVSFALCVIIESLGVCCRSKSPNKIHNERQTTINTPKNKNNPKNNYKQKTSQATEGNQIQQNYSDQINADFTVHYENRKKQARELLQSIDTRADITNFFEDSEDSTQEENIPPSFLTLMGSLLLRQLFFDLVINCQYVFIFCTIRQVMNQGVYSLMNFPSMMTISAVGFFLLASLIFCSYDSSLFGENQMKFYPQRKWMIYWIIVVGQRLVFASLIASKVQYYLFIMLALKFLSIIYFSATKTIFYESTQKYRNLVFQALHFSLVGLFTLNQQYLQPHLKINSSVPSFLMEYIYIGLIGLIIFISFIFLIRQLTNGCTSDVRAEDVYQNGIKTTEGTRKNLFTHEKSESLALFDAKNAANSKRKKKQKDQYESTKIIDDLKSRKFITNQSSRVKNIKSNQQQEPQIYKKKKNSQRSKKNITFKDASIKDHDQMVEEKNVGQITAQFNDAYYQEQLQRSKQAKQWVQNKTKTKSFMKSSRRLNNRSKISNFDVNNKGQNIENKASIIQTKAQPVIVSSRTAKTIFLAKEQQWTKSSRLQDNQVQLPMTVNNRIKRSYTHKNKTQLNIRDSFTSNNENEKQQYETVSIKFM